MVKGNSSSFQFLFSLIHYQIQHIGVRTNIEEQRTKENVANLKKLEIRKGISMNIHKIKAPSKASIKLYGTLKFHIN